MAGLRSLLESNSAVEQMMAKMLATTGRRPSDSEQRSWRASLPVLASDLVDAGLSNIEVLVEYQLPLTSKRADVVLAGVHPRTGNPTYVVVELKQWSDAQNFEGDPKLVHVAAYGTRPVLHPLEQVAGYRQYMLDFLPALQNREYAIQGIAYLHNATQLGVDDLFALPQSS
ncbi:MAG: ATP-binding protein, partial [Actinomycetota bacterium]|nr:ATP-binding protein [Actinomycetota bacterium]